mgnify:FL=1
MTTPLETRSQRIRQFTEQSLAVALPTHPRLMTRSEALFAAKMVSEELMELLSTVALKDESPKSLLMQLIADEAKPPAYTNEGKSEARLIEEQVDALVDIDYYCGNAAAKVGLDMDQVFDVVHQANMAKRFDDGQFHRNEEGKIVKPPGWQEGDVGAVVERWLKNGTWSSSTQ